MTRRPLVAQQEELQELKNALVILKKDVEDIERRLNSFVTKAQFDPVNLIVHRTIGIILGAIILGAVTFILSKGWNLIP